MNLLQRAASKTAGFLGRESLAVRKLLPAYESLLNWTSAGRGVRWTINGETFRVDSRQRRRLGSDYDAPVASFLRERVKPGAICLDVGANVGVYVLQFARWAGEAGRVIAFEPNPSAISVLHRHIAMNGLSGRVTVVPAAIGAQYGEETLYAAGVDGMSRLGEPNQSIADQTVEIKVPMITLDEYCVSEELSPDWLLMDIEGFEIAALLGARNLIQSRWGKMGIIVEMHAGVWDSANTTRADAEALLAQLRLRALPLTGQSDPIGEHGIVHLAYA